MFHVIEKQEEIIFTFSFLQKVKNFRQYPTTDGYFEACVCAKTLLVFQFCIAIMKEFQKHLLLVLFEIEKLI